MKNKTYLVQNRMIHAARAQLGMELDDCRFLAKEISGMASISALSPEQRSQMISILKEKGADIYNPPLPRRRRGFAAGQRKKGETRINVTQMISQEQIRHIKHLWEDIAQYDWTFRRIGKQIGVIKRIVKRDRPITIEEGIKGIEAQKKILARLMRQGPAVSE